MKVAELLKKEGIKFRNLDNYVMAFTHMSFVHESKIFNVESYERLEFFGDSILGYIVAEYLYNNFPELQQGDLHLIRSSLVNKKNLSKVGRELNFEKYIQLGQGEDSSKLSDSSYEDVFESLIAAIYLDLGLNVTKKFVNKHISTKANNLILDELKDFKTKLQELLQAEKGKSVTYKINKQKRINNVMYFWSEVLFDDQILGSGKGLSKKEAEQKAAKDAYERMVKK